MARRFETDTWTLAPPVIEGELIGGFCGVRGAARATGLTGARRLPGAAVVPLGGRVTLRPPVEVSQVWGPNIVWPSPGSGRTLIAMPFLQYVPNRAAMWFFFLDYPLGTNSFDAYGLTRTSTANSATSPSKILADETRSRLKVGTTIHCFGWGNGPKKVRWRGRGNLIPPERLIGIAPDEVLKVATVSPVRYFAVGETMGFYQDERPTAGGGTPSWASLPRTVARACYGIYVTLDTTAGPIDGVANQWVFADKGAGNYRWTQDRIEFDDGQSGGLYAAYSNWALPTAAGSNPYFPEQLGGFIGQQSSFYMPVFNNLSRYRDDPDANAGNGDPTDLTGGQWRSFLPADGSQFVVNKAGRIRWRYWFTDMLVLFDLPAAVGSPTRNMNQIADGVQETLVETIDYTAGTGTDVKNINLLAGPNTMQEGEPGVTVYDYLPNPSGVPPFDAGSEIRVRTTLERERWSGAVYAEDGTKVNDPIHHVTLKVEGVAQWTQAARIGLNGQTYYIDSIQGGGRLGRHAWVIEASRPWTIPAAAG